MPKLKAGAEHFRGITTNSSTIPLCQIELLVTFGAPDKFHTKKLTFDVGYFKMTYNVILGCPMLDKFMVMVHYAYHVVKIPSPKWVITVKGDQRAVFKCDKQNIEIVEQFYQTATTSRHIDSKHQRHQATGKSKDNAKDSKLIFTDTSGFDDFAKGETNDDTKKWKADGGIKVVPMDPS
ncbi:uncharacterized protein LOC133925389 [Phragmites australis]|uniref:uncharacterized protein LOC133925389 n=1 Tax=Phragmites australis TaxID=29695 RepID=UPI002D779FE3|nr:uncharacterized protein LOC133925389 [Phragmites australis]